MGFLKFDENQAKGGGLPEPGTYEVFVKAMDINKASQTGKTGTEVLMVIRDDVEQPSQGGKIYDNYWDVEAAEWRYQVLVKAAGAEQGQQFETKQDMKDFVIGKPLKVTIAHSTYTGRDGNEKDTIDVKKVEESSQGGFLPPEKRTSGEGENSGSAPEKIDIKDDDLPF